MTDAVFARRVLTALALGALGAAVLALALLGLDVLLLAFAGVLVALFLRGLAEFVRRHTPLGDTVALVVIVLGLIVLVALGGWLIAPPLVTQAAQLAEQLPRAIDDLRSQLSGSAWGRLLLGYAPDLQTIGRSMFSGRSAGTIATTLGWIVGGTANLAVVIFIGLYVAASPEVYRRGVLRLFPVARRRRARAVLDRLGGVLQRWLVGKAVGMLVIGVLTSVGLALVGVPGALALGAIAGLLNFIPYLGPVLSFLPAALLAATQSSTTLGWVLVLYVVIQGLESYVVTPLVQQEAVALPPALIITAQVLLGVVVGWLGLLLATPLTATVVVLVNQLYLERARDEEARDDRRGAPPDARADRDAAA